MDIVFFMVKSRTSLVTMKGMKNREIRSKAISRPFAKQRTALPLTQGTKIAKKTVSISKYNDLNNSHNNDYQDNQKHKKGNVH